VNKRAQYVVLCEDLQAQVFIRRVLLRCGVTRIRCLPLPSTAVRGAGDDYVRKRYPRELQAWRAQRAAAATGLVVHIDADPGNTVAQRHAQLADAARQAKIAPRGPDDAIAELVPKRNVETWIYALDPTLAPRPAQLDEHTEYRKLKDREHLAGAAATHFADHARAGTSPPEAAAVPSLTDGLSEFRRLKMP
jgi:hypothetical protein